jgi:hypothetical protein
LPLLEEVNALIKFAQRRDIFIYNFVVVVNICQANIYMMDINRSISKFF